jgi:hypothetical protein
MEVGEPTDTATRIATSESDRGDFHFGQDVVDFRSARADPDRRPSSGHGIPMPNKTKPSATDRSRGTRQDEPAEGDTVRTFSLACNVRLEAELRAWFTVAQAAHAAHAVGALDECARRQGISLITLRGFAFVGRRISQAEFAELCTWRDVAGLPLTPLCIVALARLGREARKAVLHEMQTNGRSLKKLREAARPTRCKTSEAGSSTRRRDQNDSETAGVQGGRRDP